MKDIVVLGYTLTPVELYPDTCLQVLFLVLTAFGWYKWAQHTPAQRVARTTRISLPEIWMLSAIGLVCYDFARGHLHQQEQLARHTNRLLIVDTDLITTMIYSLHYLGDCPAWIGEQ